MLFEMPNHLSYYHRKDTVKIIRAVVLAALFGVLSLFPYQVTASDNELLILRTTETYPKTGAQLISKIYVDSRFIRIDGNGITSLFDAKADKLNVLHHESRQYQTVTKETLSSLKEWAKEHIQEGDDAVDSTQYDYQVSDDTFVIDDIPTLQGRLSYAGKALVDVNMAKFSDLGINNVPISIAAWHHFFAGYLHNFPSRNLALHNYSTAGLMESAEVDVHDFGILRAIFYDDDGRIEKVVEAQALETTKAPQAVFSLPGKYERVD